MTSPGKHFSQTVASSLLLLCLFASVAVRSEILPPGFRPLPPGVHALVGGKVVVKPAEALDSGTIVVRDGLIQAVGTNVAIPADARVWDMKGATIYAGFIDPYLVLSASNSPVSTAYVEPNSAASLTSGGVKFYGAPGAKTDMGNPGPGYEIARITPEFRAAEKYSPDDKTLSPLREIGFTVGLVAPARGIIRGTSALVALADENPNQIILRPDVFQHITFETGGGGESAYPGSLMGVIAAVRQSFFDSQHYALDHADYQTHPNRRRPEFNPSLESLAPAMDKKMRVAFEPGSALMVDRAAQIARELNLDFIVVSCGQEWRRPDLAKATGAQFIVPLNFPTLPDMPGEDDWDQVSLDQLRAWDWAAENPALLRRQGLEIALTTYGLSDKKKFRQNLQLALDRGLSETDALAALTTVPAKLCGVENQLGTIEAGKLANLTVVDGSYFDPKAKIREVWIDGRVYRMPVEEPKPEKNSKPPELATKEPSAPKPTGTNQVEAKVSDEKKSSGKTNNTEQLRELGKTRVAHSPMDGRGAITNPPAILINNATIWTSGSQGILTNAQIFINRGKIEQVGAAILTRSGPRLDIDARGQFITPGVIDCHSHSFVVGAVNEMNLPSTAMVRISDVVNSETENFYEQLAGGVTMANVLHGSANPIGGQNCVIKLRDGDTPEELVYSNAPQGIKFALGENVKQSNWGDRVATRFPQTRMGVRTFYENRFTAAQQYLKDWENYRKNGGVPPRRDLELEAIGEVLQGTRLIHCHAYRQDEMLMLMRLTESFGVRIGSFQHVLEGYKIADELAAGGVTGSSFSDWWAYKFEVYDAIPYNGTLMHDRGVVVSFNSDSSDLARRLYLEAAKAVKYGGTSETEALKFVTLNPAKQLHMDKWVGSLEPGKDADFAIWSKSPLDSGTVCLQTWIDGRKYFDRSLDAARTTRLQKEREDLLAKAKKIAKLSGGGGGGGDADSKALFFQRSLEHEFDGIDRDCMDNREGGR
jgi:imidazolonepropionase-like amidohydrolase